MLVTLARPAEAKRARRRDHDRGTVEEGSTVAVHGRAARRLCPTFFRRYPTLHISLPRLRPMQYHSVRRPPSPASLWHGNDMNILHIIPLFIIINPPNR